MSSKRTFILLVAMLLATVGTVMADADCGNAFYDDGSSEGAAWFNGGKAGDPNYMFGVRYALADFGYEAGQVAITGFCAGNDIDYGGPWPNEVFLYLDDGSGMPDDSVVLAQGTIDTGDGAGQYEVTFDAPVVLNGDFWLMNRGDAQWAGEDFNMEYDESTNVGNSYGSSTGIAGLALTTSGNWVLRATLEAAGPAAPVAAFSYDPMAPEAGQSVAFTDESTGDIDTWAWDFGDGSTSDMQSPTHVFTAADAYTVSLTVSNAGGSDTATMDVTVSEAPAPTGPALSIPAAARVEGVGAFFFSVATLFNVGSSAMDVTVTYTPRDDIGGDSMDHVVSVGALQMLTVEDPLGEWFGFGAGETAVGSLMFSTGTAKAASDLMVQSVVLARNDDATEYGQGFPATATMDALMEGDTAYLASTVDAARTRVNFGAMALADGTSLTVTPVDPLGTALGTPRTINLDMGGNVALNNLDNQFSLSGAANYVVQVDVTAGSAIVFNSVLDGNASFGGTSDPTTIAPVTMGSESVTLMEIGSVQGYDEFSGSASITNLSSTDAQVDAYFYPAGSTDAEMTNFTIGAGDTVGYQDFVGDVFGVGGVGTVMLMTANQTEIMATGREFAIFRDESEEITGTAGQLMPGLTSDAMLVDGYTYHILGLQEYEGDQGLERSHVSAFNPGSSNINLVVSLYDGATGAMEGTDTYVVPAGELFKVNNVISKLNADQDGQPKRLEVSVSGDAYVLGYRVSQYGDPVTLAPMSHIAR